MMRRQLNLASIHVAGIFCLLLLIYHFVFGAYFPLPDGKMGHDYVLTLGALLDGLLWYRNNGFFDAPWFSPSFCGGQPFFADPQSIFYSLPQFLSFITDPVKAVYWAFLIFAGIGFWGMYFYCRASLKLSRGTALLAACAFMFNGFYSHRMIVGHYGYQSVMLIPLLAQLLVGIPETKKPSSTTLVNTVMAGILIAYCFHSGLTTLMIPTALAVIALACLASITNAQTRITSFMVRGLFAGVLAIGLCASKLNANFSLMANFSRDYYPLPGISDFSDLGKFIFQGLFYSSEHVYQTAAPLWKNMLWSALPHELAYGLTPIPLIGLISGILFSYIRRARKPVDSEKTKEIRLLSWALLSAILLVPASLLYYSPTWNSFLKSIPIIGSTTSPFRWMVIYIPVLCAVTGLSTQLTGRYRTALVTLSILGIPLLNTLENRDYYAAQNFDSKPITEYYRALSAGGLDPEIRFVGDPRDSNGQTVINNNLFLAGISPLHCYNPLFGYRREKLITAPLIEGFPEQKTGTDTFNMHNPACLVFPQENNCQPWDAFKTSQDKELQLFVHYKKFSFEKSTAQQIADTINWLSLLAALLILGTSYCLAGLRKIQSGPQ